MHHKRDTLMMPNPLNFLVLVQSVRLLRIYRHLYANKHSCILRCVQSIWKKKTNQQTLQVLSDFMQNVYAKCTSTFRMYKLLTCGNTAFDV